MYNMEEGRQSCKSQIIIIIVVMLFIPLSKNKEEMK